MANIIEVIKKDGSIEEYQAYPGMQITFSGDDSKVTLHEGTRFAKCQMLVGSNVTIYIGRSRYGINNLGIWTAEKTTIHIGENFSCWGVQIRCHEFESSVTIGNDCMFSEDILIYPTDVHTIYDLFSKEVLNKAKPIVIGNHVWCGRRVSILKGVTLRNDVVIGMGAVVSKGFNENNIVITGYPAMIVKRGIGWDRSSPHDYEKRLKG